MAANIVVNDLSYTIADKKILDEVSFNINENTTIGIIGPNGSGKTTILKHLYRVLPAEKNKIFINGKALEHITYRESAQIITVMKQENTSEFDYSILEIVLMGRAPYHNYMERNNQQDFEIAQHAIEKVGMLDDMHRSFSTLSGGEKQRVLIARSLAQQADIFLLDEPTNHLDVRFQWTLMDLITSLKKTVLAVFHELNLACHYCDYLLAVDKGKIIAYGTPEEVCTEHFLNTVFGIKVRVIQEEHKPYIIYKGVMH